MHLPENHENFVATFELDAPDPGWPEGLKALWHEGRGDWQASHDIAEGLETPLGYWIHAYLHRREGDQWNAGYWYKRAGRPFPEKSLEIEFREIVDHVLEG
ncbi:hypothetical protein [Robiginitalea sp. SC105]|uniref:hypothetical protein n=1 Tax=Robiginitalea sp. SC105 TaxID=2762332 RepID=UPI00163AB4A2|nr:hypothetical protein [Robiginitalea sp. SC105]MBC2840776.1 hypothetical protein [Robiginitalea sp. SC105]